MGVHAAPRPEVRGDPGVAVPEWGLSDAGRPRLRHLVGPPWVPRPDRRWDRPGQGSVVSDDPVTGAGAGPWVRLGGGGGTAVATVSG